MVLKKNIDTEKAYANACRHKYHRFSTGEYVFSTCIVFLLFLVLRLSFFVAVGMLKGIPYNEIPELRPKYFSANSKTNKSEQNCKKRNEKYPSISKDSLLECNCD